MKTHSLVLALVATLFLLGSCGRNPKSEPREHFVLPLAFFGQSQAEIQRLETQRGSTIEVVSPEHLIAFSTFEGRTSKIDYYFENDAYRVACGRLEGEENEKRFVGAITGIDGGFVKDATASQDATEELFRYTKRKFLLSLTTKTCKGREALTYSFAPEDETLLSWSRLGTLPEGELFFPLIAKNVTLDLVYRYESRLGHTYDAAASIPERAVFNFKTACGLIVGLRYWFDLKTKSKLEESAILFSPNRLPELEKIKLFLEKQGFERTPLTVGGSKDLIFYNKETKYVACVQLEPEKGKENGFVPMIQFYQRDLTDVLPKEIVDFPMPSFDFTTKTLDEIVEVYKKMPYYKGVEEHESGKIILTTSEDFNRIFIAALSEKYPNKYVICAVIAKDERTLRSPHVIKRLEESGFELDLSKPLPTFYQRKLGVTAQFDLLGLTGMPCVAFNPTELD